MRKLRKRVKDVKKVPMLKKRIANWIADMDMSCNPDARSNASVKRMLLKGNRGYLAMSEKELCDIFDKVYQSLVNNEFKQYEMLGVIDHDLLSKPRYYWRDEQQRIDKIRKHFLDRADSIYNLIFEDLVL